MGQAFDDKGNVMGGVVGQSLPDVFEKLNARFADASRMELGHNAAQVEMPRYRCHKEVHALKIVGVQKPERDETDFLLLMEHPYGNVVVTGEWMTKHAPTVGGYYVVYKDGYASFSPAEAFEDGYTRIQ